MTASTPTERIDGNPPMADMDLTPRTTETGGDSDAPRRRRNWLPILVLGLVVVAGGVIVTKFLNEAVDYYCNVDEVGVRDGCDEGRRIRLQGTVDEGSVSSVGSDTQFSISFNDETITVLYRGRAGWDLQGVHPGRGPRGHRGR